MVRLSAKYVSDNLVMDGVAGDVSAEGLFFRSDYLDGAGEKVSISLQLPWRASPLELRGQVRWVSDRPNAAGMGIRFLDVSCEDRVVLSSLGVSSLTGVGPSLPAEEV
jgi:hypothetical protein